MAAQSHPAVKQIEIVAYDVHWPHYYEQERETIFSLSNGQLLKIEHIGSTAISGQAAKPVIDMMGAVECLQQIDDFLADLAAIGYQLTETGMRNRLFLVKAAMESKPTYHLHLVELHSWEGRKERMLRDYLLTHPEAVQAYSELKRKLAELYPYDTLAYTKAKTSFVQSVIDQVCDERGLPRMDVWEE
ncbi:GrpB family protein [Cytophagaceae bacterium YF14B1]|uniref:GrpB family protein n=1 Tax=Xanthocytophaga flava TaxID=3048013 RepID=A0AAE3U681_9BACT|nr:GrpB family protein [Xanthocytophaga flavus]MDJ1481081.1 GrpB family protein [Xanthocytophaga flavus]